MSRPVFFVTGGALGVDADSYVARAADHELLEALRSGEFCYVLTCRQMGKSSLMVRAAAQLREKGCAVVILDLTAIGQNIDVEQWYFSMLCHVGEKLNLETEMEKYWEANARRAPLHRFLGAIRELYLEKTNKPLVMFVDEIDAVRSLRKFSADEFFAGIRECYNRRTEDPSLQRLTFCLLGVATPSDLIQDQRMTPFNIGRAIELSDFTETDAGVLAAGLSPYRETALALLRRVLLWTLGHPYLTQKLCAEVAKAGVQGPAEVDALCERVFLSTEARERDDNLHFVRERLLRSEQNRAALLDTYARVCRGERLADDHLNPVINELRLSGIVRVVDGRLQPRNRIYSRVFDLKWTRDNLPDAEARRQRAAFYRGVQRVAGVSIAVLAVITALAVANIRSSQRAKRAALQAARAGDSERKAAEAERKAAEAERKAAEGARAAAEWERKANENRLREAERTKAALNQLVETQTKVESLLEALTPLVGEKSGVQILERAEAVVRGVSSGATDDPRVLLGQVGLRRVCGRLYLKLGNDAKALEQAQAARSIIESELNLRPVKNELSPRDETALKKQLHDCFLIIGDAALGRRAAGVATHKAPADFDRARESYVAAAELARVASEAGKEDASWRALYFASLNNLSDTAFLFDRVSEAEAGYRDALKKVSELRKGGSPPDDLARIEALIHDRLGALYLWKDKLGPARTEFDLGLRLREQSGEAQTDDPERLSELAFSYNKLGNIFLREEKWGEALTYHQRSLALRRKLCEQSSRLDWQRNLGFTLANVALSSWKLGQNREAIKCASDRLQLTERLFGQDPLDVNLRTDYGNALYGFADILLNVSDKALQNWPKALELSRLAVASTERRNPKLLAFLAQALRLNKLPAEAKKTAEEAARLLSPPDERTPDEKQVAKEIAYELKMAKVNSPGKNPTGARTKTNPL